MASGVRRLAMNLRAGANKVVNAKNLAQDFKDPDLKSYGKSIPLVNKGVMKASLGLKSLKKS